MEGDFVTTETDTLGGSLKALTAAIWKELEKLLCGEGPSDPVPATS